MFRWFAILLLALVACSGDRAPELTVSGSAVGAEARILSTQIDRFRALHPGVNVTIRTVPDDATQRHLLYVQWLNAHAGDPDVLQLDVVWTPEFAAAGWILPLGRFGADTRDFFPAAVEANRWRGQLYGLPWFTDVGMLYWRTDLMERAPRTFAELSAFAKQARLHAAGADGFVWQGARYEGLVTVFLEFVGGFGGEIVDRHGVVRVDSPEAVAALTAMRDEIYREGITPREVLTWHEEESRFAFQNGRAAFMRNWPYARALLADPKESRVAGRFDTAPMPAQPRGSPTAALGGSQLAINSWSDQPQLAWELIAFLTAPEQMIERATAVGQYPPRRSLYREGRLDGILGTPAAGVARVIESARPRPVTPVYSELSEILQVQLHRALTRQSDPETALREAAVQMQHLLDSTGVRALMREERP